MRIRSYIQDVLVHRWIAAHAVPAEAGDRFGRVFEDCMGAT